MLARLNFLAMSKVMKEGESVEYFLACLPLLPTGLPGKVKG